MGWSFLLSFKFLFLCFLFLKMLSLPGPWIFRPRSCFCCQVHDSSVHADAFIAMFMFLPSRLRWCFCYQVHAFSIQTLMLLLSGWADTFVVRYDFVPFMIFTSRFLLPCSFFSVDVELMIWLPGSCFLRSRWCFSVHVRLMLLLQGSCFFRPHWLDAFVVFILFQLMLFPKGNLKCTIGFQLIFLFLFIFFVTHIILWICSL